MRSYWVRMLTVNEGILRECEGQERIGVLRNVNLAAVEWNPDVDHECSLNAGGDLNSDHSWLNGSRHEIGRPYFPSMGFRCT